MKTTKRVFETYSFYDHTGLASHLEKMAAHGWLVERIVNLGWVYRRIEPRKLHFTISYYPKASEFDPEPTEEQQTFHDFCQHTGWILAAASGQMQIFYNEQENPTPIETDPMLELENIRRSAKKSFLPVYFVLLGLSLLNGAMFISRLLGDPIGLLSSATNLFTGFAWTMMLLLCVAELGGYYFWYARARKAAERGQFLPTAGYARLQRFIFGAVLAGFVYWLISLVFSSSPAMLAAAGLMLVYFIALFVIVNSVKSLLKRRKAPAGVNRTITLITSFILSFAMMGLITGGTLWAVRNHVFEPHQETYAYMDKEFAVYLDELPLTVEALQGADAEYTGYIRERRSSESLFLAQFVMSQHPRLDVAERWEMPRLDYTITVIKAPVLYDLCQNRLLREQDETGDDRIPEGWKHIYEAQDAAPWGAREVYRLVAQDTGPTSWYLLCYEDRIIEIHFDWEPTPEQMSLVNERLSGR